MHRARQVDEEDFYKFDYLLAMDTSNLEDLQELGVDLSKNRKDGIGKGINLVSTMNLMLEKRNCSEIIRRLVQGWRRLSEIPIMGNTVSLVFWLIE